MFIVEAYADGAWSRDGGDYFLHDGPAIAMARAKEKKDGLARRVLAWPKERVIWPTVDSAVNERTLGVTNAKS